MVAKHSLVTSIFTNIALCLYRFGTTREGVRILIFGGTIPLNKKYIFCLHVCNYWTFWITRIKLNYANLAAFVLTRKNLFTLNRWMCIYRGSDLYKDWKVWNKSLKDHAFMLVCVKLSLSLRIREKKDILELYLPGTPSKSISKCHLCSADCKWGLSTCHSLPIHNWSSPLIP